MGDLENKEEKYRANCKRQLEPIFEMLVHKRYLVNKEWKKLVRMAEQCILTNPGQYLAETAEEREVFLN
jgi:hypothetical protein